MALRQRLFMVFGIVEMEEIIRLVNHYNKVKLRALNSRERQMPDEKADETSERIALMSLERAINEYIDARFEFLITSKYPWIIK